jgi:putative zinc finger/helix-turn-helix YgiT family protein
LDALKTKPFPWMCPNCREKAVVPVQKDYLATAEHDAVAYDLTVKDIAVPTCSRCGQVIVTSDISQRVTSELRRLAGLLTPEAIRTKREGLGLTQSQLATALRVGVATLTRWETGMQLQSRAMDLLLRLYFDSPAVRQACITSPTNSVGAHGSPIPT